RLRRPGGGLRRPRGGAFSYDSKVLIERFVKGRDLAVSVLDGEGPPPPGGERGAPRVDGTAPMALPVVEAVPREEGFYDYESRYEIRMTTFLSPPALAPPPT